MGIYDRQYIICEIIWGYELDTPILQYSCVDNGMIDDKLLFFPFKTC